MKRTTKIIVVIVVLIVVFLTIIMFSGHKEGEEEMEIIGIKGYTTYKSQNFGFSIEYPKNWIIREEYSLKSEVYHGGIGVNIRGPTESKSGIGYTSLRLQIVPSKEKGGILNNLDEYINYTIENRGIGEVRVISDNITNLAGQNAREVTISYDTKRPLKSLNQTVVSSMVKWIVIKKDGYFYDLEFSTSEDDYPEYIEAYEHAKETFRFEG